MYSTTAKMELSDIVVANLHHDVSHPKLVIEKRTGKIFALKINFTYGSGEINDIQISELGGSEVIHLRLIDLKHYYFINEIKKLGGYNTAMEPAFRTMSYNNIVVEWYEYNREIPMKETWMVNPPALLNPVGVYQKMFGKTTPANQVLAFPGIPNFETGVPLKGDVEVDKSSSWCVMRSFTLDGKLMYSNRIIL